MCYISCKDCVYYDETDSYPNTGFCSINEDFVNENFYCKYHEEE